jgi:predicted nucleotide-binding protein
VIRQLAELDFIYDAGASGSRVDLAQLFVDAGPAGEEVVRQDLRAFDSDGLIELAETYDVDSIDCSMTARGCAYVEEIRRRRADAIVRRKDARDAVLYWLYEQHVTGRDMVDLADFWVGKYAIYFGKHFEAHDVDQAADWLFERGYLRGERRADGSFYALTITAVGEGVVEAKESLAGTPPTPMPSSSLAPSYPSAAMDIDTAIEALRRLQAEATSSDVRRHGPTHDAWKAKVSAILSRALGADSPATRGFVDVPYTVGVWTGAPGEAEQDAEYFAAAVDRAVAYIDAAIYELELEKPGPTAEMETHVAEPNSVFLVHGHDEGAKHEVSRVINKLTGADPIILDEQASRSLTIVEKFEQHGGSAAFAVVLLTPDDVGRSAAARDDQLRPRARQNVVFELGYFIGKLGRGKVAVLNRGDVEKPSDVSGVLYIPYPEGNWQVSLAQEMKAAGLEVDASRLLGG